LKARVRHKDHYYHFPSCSIKFRVLLNNYTIMADSSNLRPSLKGNIEEALRLFSSEAEWSGLNLAETEFVLEETLKCYGSTFDGGMIRSLFKYYRRYVGMSDVDRRQQLLSRMTAFIINGHRERHIVLLCFISADTSDQIISGAALDLAMVVPYEPKDPLAGPKYVAEHRCGGVRLKLGTSISDEEGDAAAGLLLLGDMRLMPLLEEIWQRLSPEGRRRMIRRRTNLVYLLNVEFLLRRLESDKDEEYFGELAAALNNLPGIAAKHPFNAILDVRRNFGLVPGKEPMELIGQETMAEAFARIRPRLEALIARESEPKVLPTVFAVWAKAAGSDAVPNPKTKEDKSRKEKSSDDVNSSSNSTETQKSNFHKPAESSTESGSPTNPNYDGLLGCLYGFSLMEFTIGVFLFVWSIFTMHGSFALAVLLFSAANGSKGLLMERRYGVARWLAILAYLGMWWFSPELLTLENSRETYPVLQSIISWWCVIFGALYLLCFDFNKQMRDAPEVKP